MSSASLNAQYAGLHNTSVTDISWVVFIAFTFLCFFLIGGLTVFMYTDVVTKGVVRVVSLFIFFFCSFYLCSGADFTYSALRLYGDYYVFFWLNFVLILSGFVSQVVFMGSVNWDSDRLSLGVAVLTWPLSMLLILHTNSVISWFIGAEFLMTSLVIFLASGVTKRVSVGPILTLLWPSALSSIALLWGFLLTHLVVNSFGKESALFNFSSSFTVNFLADVLIFFSISIKLGLPPIGIWVVSFYNNLTPHAQVLYAGSFYPLNIIYASQMFVSLFTGSLPIAVLSLISAVSLLLILFYEYRRGVDSLTFFLITNSFATSLIVFSIISFA